MEIRENQTYQNVQIFSGQNHKKESVQDQKEREDNKKQSQEIIKGNELNLIGQKESFLKELLAQRAALKVQLDQFEKDLKVDDRLLEHAFKKDTLLQDAKTNQDEVLKINSLKKDLKESLGIEDDSQEQKDLELLEKKAKGDEELTEEELKRVANMGPLTEYQQAALEYISMADIFLERSEDAAKKSENEARTITAIKLGLLKSSPMVKAKEEAEEILAKVDKEIQQAIVQELKNKVDENIEIVPEDQLLMNPQALFKKRKLTEEDLKGLAVDEQI